MNKRYKILLIVGIMFIAFNLRAPLTAIGSLVNLIKDDLHISNTLAGFITTIPLLVFAILSPFISKISSKIGNSHMMFLGMIILIFGELIRSYTNLIGLFIGTILIGVGIAIGNVLIPSIIKHNFPSKIASITSIYTPCMSVFAAIGSGFSIPLALEKGLGWRNTLSIWALLGIITLIIWIPQLKRKSEKIIDINENTNLNNKVLKNTKSIWKSSLAWQVSIFMGLQSILFYILISWLPLILQDYGMTSENSGYMTLFFQLICVPSSFIASQVASKFKDQKVVAITTNVIYLLGFICLFVGGNTTLFFLSLTFIGIGSGAAVSLALSFMGLRASNAKEASELAGMAQSIGYLLSAIGPSLVGYIYDYTGSFRIPMTLFILLAIGLIIFSFGAGRNKYVYE